MEETPEQMTMETAMAPRLSLEVEPRGHEALVQLNLGIPGYDGLHIERFVSTQNLTPAFWGSLVFVLLGEARDFLSRTMPTHPFGYETVEMRHPGFTDAEMQEAERLLNDDALWRYRGMPERDAFIERMRTDHGLSVVFQTITPENTSRWVVSRGVSENLTPELEPAVQTARQFGAVTGGVAAGAAVEGLQNFRPITPVGERAVRGEIGFFIGRFEPFERPTRAPENDLPEETI